jgi:hypothetical protein
MTASKQSEQSATNLRTVYQELCTTYRAIDDFRAKLLGFLPLVSGAGVFVLLGDALTTGAQRLTALPFLEPIGLFGCAITVGLFSFEIYGIKKCHAVIRAGKWLENFLHVSSGQFNTRPQNVISIVNEPFAAGVIYPAVFAAWMYLVMLVDWPEKALVVAIICFFAGFVGTLLFDFWLRNAEWPSISEQLDTTLKQEQVP